MVARAATADRVWVPVDRLTAAVNDVAVTMLGLSFVREPSSDVASDLVHRVAVLPIPGPRPVTLALATDAAGCESIGARLFGCAVADLTRAMIDDALQEVANMAAGRLRSMLALDQALGLPTIVRHADLERAGATAPWTVVVLRSGDVRLMVAVTPQVF
jgi:hypothetical protein